MKEMVRQLGSKIYDKYGFKDAFNLSIENLNGSQGWCDVDYIGIDQGPIEIQIENYKNEFVWELMKKNPCIVDGLKKAGSPGDGFKTTWQPTQPLPNGANRSSSTSRRTT